MRRCAICGGGERTYRGWLGVAHALCWPCRQAISAHYQRGPVRHRDRVGRQLWAYEEVRRRLPCPANTGQQAGVLRREERRA